MGKKGGTHHMKRQASPSFWPIHRKEFTWSIRPKPGPHSIYTCMPLAVVVREALGLAQTRKEAKQIISQNKVLVDGKVVRDERFPTGLMDVISIPDLKANYRVVPSTKGLILHPIKGNEAKFKLCRIENKKTVKRGHIELNLHDGRNLVIPVGDARKPEEDTYETLDTLQISVPEQEILGYLKLKKGASIAFVDGRNIGKYGAVDSIVEQTGQKRRKFLITIKNGKGEAFQTILDYAFVVGDKKPIISLPETEEP